MGVWGIGIYDNDIASDVKEDYIDLLKQGRTNEEATEKMIKEWETNDIDEDSIFWITLADIQWEYGRLLQKVKERAIHYIDNKQELEKWTENEKLYNKRKNLLEELKRKLNSQMPKEKRIYRYKNYKCQWNIGDVYAYKIKNNPKYQGKYIVCIKVSEKIYYPHNICPVVYVYNKIFDEIPEKEDLIVIQYLPQFYIPTAYMKDGKISVSKNTTEGKSPKEILEDYIFDRNRGILYKCQIGVENSTKELIEEYVFLGNIKDYKIPDNEDTTINDTYLCLIEQFEESQIEDYENWKEITY